MVDIPNFYNLFFKTVSYLDYNRDKVLPATALISVTLLILNKLFIKIRKKFNVTVNCWFCNSNSSVPYNSSNSWYCHHCDQYNGFSLDGSYNRVLVEQFSEKMNCGSWCERSKMKSSNTSNGLCRFCNINLELKVQQLAQFIPLNSSNYDEEVQLYSDQLERVYRLCSRCQKVLDQTLSKKYELFVTPQQHKYRSKFEHPCSQIKEKSRHSAYLWIMAALSVWLLLLVFPHEWAAQLRTEYPPPDWLVEIWSLVPDGLPSSAVLFLGIVVQVFDCVYMKDFISFGNLILWVVLISLTCIPVQVDGLKSAVYMVASAVFFMTSIMESRFKKPRTVAAVKPVQLHKLDGKSKKGCANLAEPESVTKQHSPKYPVSDPSPIPPRSSPVHEPTPDDFGFSKLNVSSRRVTRSQTKPFQAKHYGAQARADLFKPKQVNLTPPKLQFETSDFQVPLTRSSSQSSGFVSLSHHKEYEEDRSPSITGDNIESVSQCGVNNTLAPYQSSLLPTMSFPNPYGLPFSHYQPYTIVHYTPPHLNKFWQYPTSQFESPFSISASSTDFHPSFQRNSWFQSLKSVFSSMIFFFLITSNIAILWKVFGEDYFKTKSLVSS